MASEWGRLPSDQDASGRSFGVLEQENLATVMASGTLFGPKGTFVKRLEGEFSSWANRRFAVACSSGTAAIHTALAALRIEPGEEVVTSPITDIGALTPILFQGGIPVFCDVDPETGNITADTVRERLSARTRAVVVTHLLGNPADVAAIRDLADHHGVAVVEDCAQAFGATIHGEMVGSFGIAAAFSLQQGKHITSGEGGLVTTDDADIARHMRLFVNKAWDYDEPSDHDFLAPNYRMSELEAAVAVAQLGGIDENIETRRQNFELLNSKLHGLDGIKITPSLDGGTSSYWRVGILVDPGVIAGGTDALASKLRSVDVPAASRYIKKPAFQTRLFQEQNTFGDSRWPFTLATEDALDYSPQRYPGVFEFLGRILVLPWNERLQAHHIDAIGGAIESAASDLAREVA